MQSALAYMKQYGTSYYYATLFFPASIKRDVIQLYKFVRIPDLIVDNKDIHPLAARMQLESMRNEREDAYRKNDIDDVIWGESVTLFHQCNIPFSLSKDFRQAMLADTEKNRYDTYAELQEYMYGSAMVVGEMMCYVVRTEDIQMALPYAKALGEAMQLTNFLRDIREDYKDFGRVYMQSEDLARFGLSHESIIEYCNMYEKDDRWIAFMQMQIQKADDLYSYALTGVRYLPKVARKAIYLSAKLYQEILRKIERLDYDVFSSSAKTTKFDKSKVLMTQARYILLK